MFIKQTNKLYSNEMELQWKEAKTKKTNHLEFFLDSTPNLNWTNTNPFISIPNPKNVTKLKLYKNVINLKQVQYQNNKEIKLIKQTTKS